jgi:hypothetical protein
MAAAVRLEHFTLAAQWIEQQPPLTGGHRCGKTHPQDAGETCQAGDFFRIIHSFYSTPVAAQKPLAWYRPHNPV